MAEENNLIHIVDYQMGNIYSLFQACKHINFKPILCTSPEDLETAKRIILPGVGSFGTAVKKLEEKGLGEKIKSKAEQGAKVMGICLGFQLLFEGSEECTDAKGLGFFNGYFKKFPDVKQNGESMRYPHIGWEKLKPNTERTLDHTPFRNFNLELDKVYFVHSYYLSAAQDNILASSKHENIEYPCAVLKENVFGVQFHPEKSRTQGLNMIKDFFS